MGKTDDPGHIGHCECNSLEARSTADEDLYVTDLYAMWSEGLIPLEVWKSRPFHKDMNWLDSQS